MKRFLVLLVMFSFTQAQTIDDVVKQFSDINIRTDKGGAIVIGYLHDGQTDIKVVGNESIDEQTIFEIGSLTKPLTGLLLADLVNRGKVSLDDSINKYLPAEVQKPAFEEVTLQRLATHTSGLPKLPPTMNWLWMLRNSNDPYGAFGEAELYTALAKTNPKDSGKQSAYSNYGFGLLGFLLAKSQDESYEALLQKTIFEPLEMTSSHVQTQPSGLTLAPPLTDKGRTGDQWTFQEPMVGAGAVKSNMHDMLLFLNACLNESALTEAVALATQPFFKLSATDEVGLAWVISKHWVISKEKNQTVIWDNGETGGYAAFLGFNPGTKQGLVVLSNLTIGDDLPKRGVNFLLGQPIVLDAPSSQ
jgi:serine-type D-Ala-D-Ala carboxypeptidase/endopeptidase